MKQLFVFSGYEFITLGVSLLLSCHEQAGFYVLVRRSASHTRTITGTFHVVNFLGVFAWSRSERISLVMSVRMHRRGPRWTDFHEI
jgi:hypothetical protein